MDATALLERHVEVVDSVVRSIAIRTRMSADAAADFRSQVLLHLLKDDGRVLRAFEGRCTITSYLSVVIGRLWHDEVARRWRRWRPSIEARRLGPVAMRLEQLTSRDGLSLDEAVAVLGVNTGVSRPDVLALWRRLPVRVTRRHLSDEALAEVPAEQGDPARALAVRVSADRCSAALRRSLRGLGAQDRRIIHLRFACGWTIADIARHLGLRQPAIYPRLARVLARLRVALEAQDVTANEVITPP